MVSVITQVIKPLSALTTWEGKPTFRKSFAIKEKQKYIQAIDAIVSQGISHHKACSILGLHPVYYAHFKKVLWKVDDLENGDAFVVHTTNGTAGRVRPGLT